MIRLIPGSSDPSSLLCRTASIARSKLMSLLVGRGLVDLDRQQVRAAAEQSSATRQTQESALVWPDISVRGCALCSRSPLSGMLLRQTSTPLR